MNLLGNALKFTEEGSIHLSLEWQALDHDGFVADLRGARQRHRHPPERLEYMFDAFQQADSSISSALRRHRARPWRSPGPWRNGWAVPCRRKARKVSGVDLQFPGDSAALPAVAGAPGGGVHG
ncbi:hypothetical protein [Pseudomonas aeruginosa]|uniref:hypothetical protein n=1 Tax=Pseudomonas aeruginosa TaxID=287 RepID=UPI003D9C5391